MVRKVSGALSPPPHSLSHFLNSPLLARFPCASWARNIVSLLIPARGGRKGGCVQNPKAGYPVGPFQDWYRNWELPDSTQAPGSLVLASLSGSARVTLFRMAFSA